ncbi:MAG: hypothetical protein JWN87_1468, partial [Frankiales bacterium]|nr:hypothetical protein [Frankiales bacterium]
ERIEVAARHAGPVDLLRGGAEQVVGEPSGDLGEGQP